MLEKIIITLPIIRKQKTVYVVKSMDVRAAPDSHGESELER